MRCSDLNSHSRVYATPEEESYRKSVFTDNFNRVNRLNEMYKQYEAPSLTIQVSWADRTKEEFDKSPEGIEMLKDVRD